MVCTILSNNHIKSIPLFVSIILLIILLKWKKSKVSFLKNRRILTFIPLFAIILIIQIAFHPVCATELPNSIGGKDSYSPIYPNEEILLTSIFLGFVTGLITGCIGVGGGFIITPFLMSMGIKGILAVGTDQFHIFAKSIMGALIHRRLGNVCVPLALTFVTGSVIGATVGGTINRNIFYANPIISDIFINIVYVLTLGFIGLYALHDFLKLRKKAIGINKSGKELTHNLTKLALKMQSINLPPMIYFDHEFGGRKVSAWFVIFLGFIVGLASAVMGVGGGFLTFPFFIYILGVSSFTTVGTDIFQIIITSGYSSIVQYAAYGFVFYTLAMGLLLGSLIGIQIGSLVTKVVKGLHIKGFYALIILAGFTNRLFSLPSKFVAIQWINLDKSLVNIFDFIGLLLFIAIIVTFTVWILSKFIKNLNLLKGMKRKRELMFGLILATSFLIMLSLMLTTSFNGKNLIAYADERFNSYSKQFSYFIPQVREDAKKFTSIVKVTIDAEDQETVQKMALLYKGCATVTIDNTLITIEGNLTKIFEVVLLDSECAFYNNEEYFIRKYGFSAKESLFYWHLSLTKISQIFAERGMFEESLFIKNQVLIKGVEPAYNFYGVKPIPIDTVGVSLLVFYVIYTLWWGFSIYLIFEGIGIRIEKIKNKKEI